MDGQVVSVAGRSANREVTLAHAGRGDVLGLKIGKIRKHRFTGLPGCQLAENRGDGDSQISDAGHSAHSIRVNRYAIEMHRRDRTSMVPPALPRCSR